MQERRALKAGSIHRAARPDEGMWCTRPRGFLPARDPIIDLDPPYTVLLELVARMPTALASGTFRALVLREAARFAPLAAAIAAEASAEVLERVHGLYGYIGKGFVHGVVDADGAQAVPSFLAEGWLAVSSRIGRHPTIDYANCVLYNWQRIDASLPLTPENLRLLNRFTGLVDEEWFLKTHVIIESEAAGAVAAIEGACDAIANGEYDKLLAMLGWLEHSISHVATNCLWIMFERSEDEGFLCEPDFFFHRFRPYISTWTALFEGQYEDTGRLQELREELAMVDRLAASASSLPSLADHRKHLTASVHALQARKRLAGPSGAMSSLLPLCDAFCDIQMSSAELGKMLEQFETYAPVEHQQMLREVRRKPARPTIVQLAHDNHPQAATLVDHFNAVVRRVLDFRWRHLSYIEQYVLKPSGMSNARGTGGTPAFAYLNQHINDTEAALISDHLLSRRGSHDDPDGDTDSSDEPDAIDLASIGRSLGSGPASPRLSNVDDGGVDLRPISEMHLPVPLAEPAIWAVSDSHGLLPSSVPLEPEAMPPAWQPVLALADAVPAACVPPPTFRALVKKSLFRLPTSCEALVDAPLKERGRCLLAFIIAGWSASGVDVPTTPRGISRSGVSVPDEVPTSLWKLFEEASALVQRAPRFGIVDMCLYNWRMAPPEPPAQAVSPMLRFLCVEEEAWFCRLHVTLAGEAAQQMTAIRKCFGAKTVEQQVKALQQLESALETLVRVHYQSGIGQPIGQDGPKVRPALLMHRLHRFLPYEKDVIGLDADEQRAARVYCATGIDQSCLLHLMGVVKGQHALQTFREWQTSDGAGELPLAHREWLRACLHRASIRDEVEREVAARTLSINDLSRLELAYNSCIDMMLRYFARRNELMRQMFGADTLKEAFDLERAAILAARLKLLVDRRADGMLLRTPSNILLSPDTNSFFQ